MIRNIEVQAFEEKMDKHDFELACNPRLLKLNIYERDPWFFFQYLRKPKSNPISNTKYFVRKVSHSIYHM